MTAEEAVCLMKEFAQQEPEIGHQNADDLLCNIIRELTRRREDAATWEQVVQAFRQMERWYE